MSIQDPLPNTSQEAADPDRMKRICKRWGVSNQTVRNWQAKGEEINVPPPLDSPAGRDLLEWYRGAYGRQPVKKLMDLVVAEEAAQVPDEPAAVIIDTMPIRVIKAALERLGLALTHARLVEEEERCWAEYQQAQAKREPVDIIRRRWSTITEEKRKVQGSKDATTLALELFKEWMRAELEPLEVERRKRISGAALGLQAQARLRATTTDAEWARVWDEELEAALANAEAEHGKNPVLTHS